MHQKKTLIALLTTLGLLAALAGPASAAQPYKAKITGKSIYTIQGDVGSTGPGALCRAVPTTDGRTMPLSMVVTSDSRKRKATVEYVLPYVIYEHGYTGAIDPLPIDSGEITVVAASVLDEFYEPFQVQRWDKLAGLRDNCFQADNFTSNDYTVIHFEPVQLPSLQTILAWCAGEGEGWEDECPTWAAALE